jgi:hypothetical protein
MPRPSHRRGNLELVKLFGGPAWKLANQRLEGSLKVYQGSLQRSRKEIDAINRKRKADQARPRADALRAALTGPEADRARVRPQVKVKPALQALEAEWWENAYKNHEIELACVSLEDHIRQAKRECVKR